MRGGVAAAMWLEGDYVNDLHYFSIEAMFAGRVCALSCFCKFLLWNLRSCASLLGRARFVT